MCSNSLLANYDMIKVEQKDEQRANIFSRLAWESNPLSETLTQSIGS